MSELKLSRLGIHIKVKDFEKSYKFYKAFGFEEEFAYGPEDFIKDFDFPKAPENYRGVTFNLGNAMLEIGEDHVAIKPEVFKESIKSSKVSAMVDVNSVDEVVKICNQNNFDIAKEPRTFPWGTREVVVRDPDGFILVFREKNY